VVGKGKNLCIIDTYTMALNWTMLNPNRSPIPLPNEQAIITVSSGAELSLTVPDTPPTQSASAGGSGGAKNLKGSGGVWLTDQRVRIPQLSLIESILRHLLFLAVADIYDTSRGKVDVRLVVRSSAFDLVHQI
jgi:hypothetical protein